MLRSIKHTCSSCFSELFYTYSTVKVVQIPNTLIAILNRIIQLIIIVYISCYIVWYKKGYQQFQEPSGTSVIKLKGVASVKGNSLTGSLDADNIRLWDTAEYQIPPLENNAFFLVTRKTVTYNQTEGNCPSALDDKLFCNDTTLSACEKDQSTPNTFGYFTGKCVPSSENASLNVCEIHAWCPEELSSSVDYNIDRGEMENFTVYLKTMISFSMFNISLRNVRDDTNFSCRYHKTNDPRCPIFRIGDILDSINTNRSSLILEGGLIEIRQDWTCNFDFDSKRCFPTVEFNLLQSGDDKQSPGINYRLAQKYVVGNVEYRTLSKIYGLRFIVAISGKGGQFSIVELFISIGSGIGFMVLSDIVCDVIFMYIHKARQRYRQGKIDICDMSPDGRYAGEFTKQINGIEQE